MKLNSGSRSEHTHTHTQVKKATKKTKTSLKTEGKKKKKTQMPAASSKPAPKDSKKKNGDGLSMSMKCIHSRAYHKAAKDAEYDGCFIDEVRQRARAAAKLAVEEAKAALEAEPRVPIEAN